MPGSFEAIEGNLIITSTNVRFEPGFPGLIQTKLISARSTFNIMGKAERVVSSDPRIIPELINYSISPLSRNEIIKLTFDPNKQVNEVKKKKRKKKIRI